MLIKMNKYDMTMWEIVIGGARWQAKMSCVDHLQHSLL